MIGTISAASFYNHDVSIERLTALTEDKQDELREFYEEIGEMCREDTQSLLTGMVDTALTGAIAKIVSEEQQSDWQSRISWSWYGWSRGRIAYTKTLWII